MPRRCGSIATDGGDRRVTDRPLFKHLKNGKRLG